MLGLIIQILTDKVPQAIAEVFSRLYEEFMPKVLRYLNYRITDLAQAEDLTAAVFEKALTNFNKYSTDKSSFSTWIFSIARNTLIDYYRASANQQAVQSAVVTNNINTNFNCPEDDVIKTEEVKILQTCIAQLDAQEKEIISLKFGGEMTNRQIAKILGLSESNVGTITYRTVRKLRDKFAEAIR